MPRGRAGFHRAFKNFNDVSLVVASLGQVHGLRLRSAGKRVAIKIQHPRLQDIYNKDLAMMVKIARLVNSFGRGSGGKNAIFSNGPNSTSECSKLLY